MNNPDMEKPESLQLPLQSDTKDFSFDHLKKSMMQCLITQKIFMC